VLEVPHSGIADQALRAAALAAAIVVVVLLAFVPLSSNDFWLQVSIGDIIWTSGEIPGTVLFTFTEARDFPFYAYEWLPSVGFYLLHEAFGYDNLLYVKGMLGLGIFALCCRLAYRLTSSLPNSLFLAVAAMSATNFRFFMRPEIFACLFLMILLNLIVEFQKTRKLQFLVWTIPLSVAWANSHGSFPIALVIMAIFAAGEGLDTALAGRGMPLRARMRAAIVEGRPYAICCGAMLLAMLANPYGYKLFVFAWDFAQWDVTRAHIVEWTSTFESPFLGSRGYWLYLALIALCAVIAAASWRKLRATDLLLLLAFGFLSADRQRHVVWFGFVSLLVMARLIGPAALAPRDTRRSLAFLVALLAMGVGVLLSYGNLYGAYPYFVQSNNFTPVMLEYMRERDLRGNMFNSYALGAELIQKFYPRLRPSIDSRIDAYGEAYFNYFSQLYSEERLLLEFIERYDVRYMLLLWGEFEMIRKMERLPKTGWRMLLADHKMVLLGRDAPDAGAPDTGKGSAKPR